MRINYIIAKKVLSLCLQYLYSYIDKNNDGKIDKVELKLLYKDFNKIIKKLNGKTNSV